MSNFLMEATGLMAFISEQLTLSQSQVHTLHDQPVFLVARTL